MKTLSSLPVGARVFDPGSRFMGVEVEFLVAAHSHPGYPAGSATLVCERIAALRCFDAPEPLNVNGGSRQASGNNRLRFSNLLQWLNSDKGPGEWYVPRHPLDAPPIADALQYSPYDTDAGFLHGFSADFRSALLETSLAVPLPPADGEGNDIVPARMFTPSAVETGLAEPDGSGDAPLPLFAQDPSRLLACPTAQAVENTNYTGGFSAGSPWYYHLRTPENDDYRIADVNNSGALGQAVASDGSEGARPMCNLPGDTLVDEEPDANGRYRIVWGRAPAITGEDGDLGEKAGAFEYGYAVSAGEAVSVTEAVDGEIVRAFAAVPGAQQLLAVDDRHFLRLANGAHTLAVTATGDETGLASAREVTFTKRAAELSLSLAAPLPALTLPAKITLRLAAEIPDGAVLRAEACNNAFDDAPAWEDVTQAVAAGAEHVFANAAFAAARPGVNLRVTVSRGDASRPCWISMIGGAYE